MPINPETKALIVTIVYEVLARVIPTVKDYTIVGKALAFLKRVSDFLNIKKQ